ncbi:delta(7)-sterol 5(6)-desaturase erg32-like [Zootermopsis nevadensis]|uniref:Putative C-5 sterol desaturase n=1 Tax=Zootermopsis nevadensis TaxID=136037 RepID=A0A067REM4_ZOONE|nr:delta(7)-sterol 5(6)-desaturase erg32-like [Zootermopsis nevadensis]KDR17319.1 putative C-5 sterol desaturase [Zootermopsis nevadensis]
MGTTIKESEKHVDGSSMGDHFYDPMAVTWMEKYSDTMEKIWTKLPNYMGSIIVALAVFTLGATIRGEWLLILVHFVKYLEYNKADGNGNATFSLSDISLEKLYLKDLQYFWFSVSVTAYAMYFLMGGFLHWYYYVKQRDNAEEWKCQPHKWLPPDLERHEIILGSLSLLISNTVTAIIACYINNGGWCTVYYKFDEYTWIWWFLQFPVIFIYQDYMTYWLHRMYHTPFLYKHFHKLHHKYKQPTAFSTTAIHPVELVHIQLILASPLFVIPVHFIPFYIIMMYTYYHGIIDHSGINFKAYWWQPWQPGAIFHDNHHQYFHVNFAFNCFIWDKLHGTYRRKDRIYTEEIYYGRGKELREATEEEIKNDLQERESENPLAYNSNKNEFKLTKDDLKKHR